ncbi:MAG: O-antigen ligase family protein [Deltaproteobacteria bacterium]|nr:O-antigen ligase family protein [Deltaproteobacteria bacterium]
MMLWVYSTRLAILFLVLLRTIIDAVGPFFPLSGDPAQLTASSVATGYNTAATIELTEVSGVLLFGLSLFTLIILLIQKKIKLRSYDIAAICFILALSIGIFRSSAEIPAYPDLLRPASWMLFLIIFPQLIRDERDIRLFIFAGFLASLIPLAGGIHSLLTGYKVGAYYGVMSAHVAGLKDIQGWFHSPPNLGALTSSIFVFPLMMLFWQKKRTWSWFFYLALIMTSIYFIYRTYHRASLIAVIVLLLSTYLLIYPSMKKVIVSISILSVLWILTISTGMIKIKLADFDLGATGGESSIYHRLLIWTLAVKGWFEGNLMQKLFGRGLNAVRSITWGKGAHNDYFELLYSYGLVPLIAYVTFQFLLIKEFFRLRKKFRDYLPYRQLCCVAIALFCGSSAIANSMRSLWSLQWMFYIATFFGLTLSLNKLNPEKDEIRQTSHLDSLR